MGAVIEINNVKIRVSVITSETRHQVDGDFMVDRTRDEWKITQRPDGMWHAEDQFQPSTVIASSLEAVLEVLAEKIQESYY